MPDQTQQPMNLPPTAPIGIPETPEPELLDEEEELAKQELARISPSAEKLLELAAKNPPLPKWFDEEEPPPF
jgi:hypothetical protein